MHKSNHVSGLVNHPIIEKGITMESQIAKYKQQFLSRKGLQFKGLEEQTENKLRKQFTYKPKDQSQFGKMGNGTHQYLELQIHLLSHSCRNKRK